MKFYNSKERKKKIHPEIAQIPVFVQNCRKKTTILTFYYTLGIFYTHLVHDATSNCFSAPQKMKATV